MISVSCLKLKQIQSTQKISLIGNGGGGKSTLARKLGVILELPLFHVDSIQYQSGWVRREASDCARILDEIASSKQWILDGFGADDVMLRRFHNSDLVIFVDFDLRVHYWWALKRQLKSGRKPRAELPPNCPEYSLSHTWRLFKILWRVHHEFRPWLLKAFESELLKHKVVCIHSPAELNLFHQKLDLM